MDLIQSFQEDHGVKLPTKKEVCPRCDGEGTHVNPAVDGFTANDLDERYGPDADEFLEGYFRGDYDVRCEECRGENVVDVVNEEGLDPEILQDWEAYLASYYEDLAIQASERRMGA